MKGKLIVVEGPDGAGKTLLCRNLVAELEGQGIDVLSLREPGGCELSEHVRDILKGHTLAGALTSDRAEALLFAAARAQLVEEVIVPALDAGKFIICDRGKHSSLVYQGLARGLPVGEVAQLSDFAYAGLKPDRVLALQVSVETARGRMYGRDGGAADRIEQSLSMQVIRDGYANLKALDPHEVVEVSAEGSPDEVLALCMDALSDLLPGAAPLTDAERADKAVRAWVDAKPNSRGFRPKAVINHAEQTLDFDLTTEEVDAALERAVVAGTVVRLYDVLCPETGETLVRASDVSDIPMGFDAVECDRCSQTTHDVDGRDIWVCYAPTGN